MVCMGMACVFWLGLGANGGRAGVRTNSARQLPLRANSRLQGVAVNARLAFAWYKIALLMAWGWHRFRHGRGRA